MKRAWRWLVIAALALTGCAHAPRAHHALIMDPVLLQALHTMHDEMKLEFAFCLTGYIDHDDVMHLRDLRPMAVRQRTNRSGLVSRCAGKDVVGFYHNHPNVTPEWCPHSISHEDEMVLEGFKWDVLLVSCNDGFFAFKWVGINETPVVVEPALYLVGEEEHTTSK